MNGPSDDLIERINRELARRSERLAVAMRELEHFSFGVAHDFRAPLRAIGQIAHGIEHERGRSDPEMARKLHSIVAHGAAMEAMIEKLLGFCRLASLPLELQPIDMEALVHAAWSETEHRERVTLTVAKLPAARGDREMLMLVWSSLLANAVKYSSKSDRPCIEVTGGESPGHVVYGVRDNGAGFELAYAGKLSHVFELLGTGAEYPGTGVALAIVQRIVTRHRGNVWIDTHVGKGAFFQFSLPLELPTPARG